MTLSAASASNLKSTCRAPVDSATLILRCDVLQKNTRIYKLIDKLGGICICEAPRELMAWITNRAKTAHGITFTAETSRLLADLVGSDLGRLDNELWRSWRYR